MTIMRPILDQLRTQPHWENEIKWAPSGSALPMTHESPSQLGVGVIITLFGFAFLLFITFFLATEGSPLGPGGWLLSGVFALMGLVIIVAGIAVARYHSTITISRDTVQYRETGLRNRSWVTHHSSYQGVLKHSEYHSGSRSGGHSSGGHTEYLLTLHHGTDKGRNVTLFRCRGPGAVNSEAFSWVERQVRSVTNALDEEANRFAQLLGLAVLEQNLEGLRTVGTGKQQIRSSVPPPKSYAVEVPDLPGRIGTVSVSDIPQGVALTFYRGHLWLKGLAGIVVLAAFTGMMLVPSLMEERVMMPFAIAAGVAALLTVGAAIHLLLLLVSTDVLSVTASGIGRHIRYPWGAGRQRFIRRGELRDIAVKKRLGDQTGAVKLRIESRQTTIIFDIRTTTAQKVLIKNFLRTRMGLIEHQQNEER